MLPPALPLKETLVLITEHTTYFAVTPVAWLIADQEDSVTMDSFLKAVKLRSPTTSINTAMTDDSMNIQSMGLHYYNA